MITIEVKHEERGEGGTYVSEHIKKLIEELGLSCLLATEDLGRIECKNPEKFLSQAKKDGYKVVVVDYDDKVEIRSKHARNNHRLGNPLLKEITQ